jgi:hypothetical protein
MKCGQAIIDLSPLAIPALVFALLSGLALVTIAISKLPKEGPRQ